MGVISSEGDIVKKTQQPNTITTLKRNFEDLGIEAGQVVIVHASLSKIGWTVGGPVSVIKALMQVLTSKGTLVMPTFSGENTEPSQWENPPVPKNWWKIIRSEMPAFHPQITPTRGIGTIAETFRKWPKVKRSNHPVSSFAAWGKFAKKITKNHNLIADLGENSPLSRIYDLNGIILLIGVSHDNNTSIHLAEYRSEYDGKKYNKNGSAILKKKERKWVEWEELDLNNEDFRQIGKQFESEINYTLGKIGLAEAMLISQRSLIDFAVHWMNKNR
ncbi:MAG TPA: AAC(3) family N-acetyltransferase [archaeon]|nr:AAC(3) family N-acetyltransferase [archaeon]